MKPIDRFKNVVNKVVTSKKPDRRLHDVIREVIAANKLEAGQSTVNTEDTRPIPIDQKTTFNGVEISQLSKRQRKKYEKCLKWQEVKKGKRAKEREKMREKRRLARMSNLCLGPSRKELKRSKMKDSSCQVGVAIDLSFDHLMIDKAAKNNETIEEKRSNPSSEDRPVASSDVGDKSDDGLNNRRFQSDSHVFDIDLKSVYPDGNAFAFLSDDSDEEKAEKQKLPYSAGIQLEAEVSLLVSEEDKPQVILENHPVPLIERKAETQRSDDKSRSREHFDSIRTLPQSDSSCFEDLSLWELPRDRMHPIVHPSKRFLRVQSGAKALRELRRSYLVDWHENQLPSNWRTKPVIVDLPHRMRKCKNANKDVMADKLIEIMDANVDKVMEIDQKTTEFVLNGERSDEKCWCEEAQERERPWWRNRTLIMLWIIIGLFLADMAKTIKQILRIYTENRRAKSPMQLHLTNFNGRYKDEFAKHHGYENWDINFHVNDYLEVFPKEKLVYLSSESENIIKTLEPDKVYIIGGLVDHNSHKGICYKKAVEQGIAHGQLPISEYFWMKHRKVLTINQVFEILLRVAEGKTFKEAFELILPKRIEMTPMIEDSSTETKNTPEDM